MSRFYRFVLLGDPVAHSRSPDIHRVALKLTGLEGDYAAVRADPQILAEAVQQLRSGLLDGINVTMPLKGAACEIADTLTTVAERAGSVNTLYRTEQGVEGDSTDAAAFADIAGEDPFSEAEEFLVLGAGGSAAAALAGLGQRRVVLSARSREKAAGLASRLGVSELVPWGEPRPGAVLVNATPLGMEGEDLPEGVLDAAAGLIDLPYGRSQTPAVIRARELRVPVVDGAEFLARQAAISFQRWTGRPVDFHQLLGAARGSV